MIMSKQVLSIEQMQHLKELGVDTSKATMCWMRVIRPETSHDKKRTVILDWFLSLSKETIHTGLDIVEEFPAFTLQDILDLLPYEVEKFGKTHVLEFDKTDERYRVYYINSGRIIVLSSKVNLIDAAYEMLCWVIEDGYFETNK